MFILAAASSYATNVEVSYAKDQASAEAKLVDMLKKLAAKSGLKSCSIPDKCEDFEYRCSKGSISMTKDGFAVESNGNIDYLHIEEEVE